MYHLQVASAANIVRASGRAKPLSSHVEISILKHQNEGLFLIRNELQTLTEAPSDALLMAMVMAGMLANAATFQIPDSFRLSPLATASSLHIYAKLDINPETIYALVDMVNRRGGIQTVKIYGMRSILQMSVFCGGTTDRQVLTSPTEPIYNFRPALVWFLLSHGFTNPCSLPVNRIPSTTRQEHWNPGSIGVCHQWTPTCHFRFDQQQKSQVFWRSIDYATKMHPGWQTWYLPRTKFITG